MSATKLLHLDVPDQIIWACIRRDSFSRYSTTVKKILLRMAKGGVYTPTSIVEIARRDRPTLLSLKFTPTELRELHAFLDKLPLKIDRTQIMLNMLLDHMAADVGSMPVGWAPLVTKRVGNRKNLRLKLPPDLVYGLHLECRSVGLLLSDLLDEILTKHSKNIPPVNYRSGVNLKKLKLGDIPYTPFNYRLSAAAGAALLRLSAGTRASTTVFMVDLVTNYLRYLKDGHATAPGGEEPEFPPLSVSATPEDTNDDRI